ncbi:MAG: hypothetical protein NO117_02430 [Sulfolobales archaeon]|nr:hypothetical protein [Sulfolobales archaeon]
MRINWYNKSYSITPLLSLTLAALLIAGYARPVTAQSNNLVNETVSALGSLVTAIILAIPSVIVFLIIILIGYFVADIVARALRHLFNLRVFQEPHIQQTKDLIIGVTKAIIILIALSIAFSMLNLGTASVYTQEISEYLPSLGGAIVLLTLGITLVNMLTDYMYSKVKTTLSDPFMDIIFNILRFGLIAIIIVIAVNLAIIYWIRGISPYLFYDIIIGSIVLLAAFSITDRAMNSIQSAHPDLSYLVGFGRFILYTIFLLLGIAIIIQPFSNVTYIINTLTWGLTIAFAIVLIPLAYFLVKRIAQELK